MGPEQTPVLRMAEPSQNEKHPDAASPAASCLVPPKVESLEHDSDDEPYSLFTPPSTRFTIMVLLGLSVLSSPLTATIYLPLLPPLAEHFSTSTQSINLTITIYIVFQALSPLLLSTYSDTLGRRPLYLITFAIFSLASLGLALNRASYAGLLVLRALQSLGASCVLSIVYGTVADICPSSRRGRMLGPVMAAGNLGTAIGPVLGGTIAYTSGSVWRAFWALAIFSGFIFLAFLLVMPETARKLVNNGAVNMPGSRWQIWNTAVFELPRAKWQGCSQPAGTRQFTFKSPLKSITLMRHPDTLLTLYIVGSYYALWYTIQASIPSTFSAPPYAFNELQLGLAYLPGATGVIVCMCATGKAMDYNYRETARRHDLPIDKQCSDIAVFPIERARSRFCMPLLLLSIACTIGYGWSVHTHTHVSLPLILLFLIGFLATWILNVFNALLVDVYPETPSAAATAGNLWRCGLSAAAVATIDPLFTAIGRGWFFIIAGILSCAFGVLAMWLLNKKGMRWRQGRSGVRQVASIPNGTVGASDVETVLEKEGPEGEPARNQQLRRPHNGG